MKLLVLIHPWEVHNCNSSWHVCVKCKHLEVFGASDSSLWDICETRITKTRRFYSNLACKSCYMIDNPNHVFVFISWWCYLFLMCTPKVYTSHSIRLCMIFQVLMSFIFYFILHDTVHLLYIKFFHLSNMCYIIKDAFKLLFM